MERYSEKLRQLEDSGNHRSIPRQDAAGCIDFSSNDYLGLALRTDLQDAFFGDAARRIIPMTSSASRLLAHEQAHYHNLEQKIGELYGRSCLLFNSGYHANVGLVSAFADKDTLILADRLVHASIIDGIMLSKCDFMRFRHNDYRHLADLLERKSKDYGRVLVVIESVYSMDGDRADIDSVARVKNRYPNVMLYVDEAHAFGVEGPCGLGLCKGAECYDGVDVIVGTFGKALASMGAFAVMSPMLRDYAVNFSRSLIFSTALPPMNCEWTSFMIDNMLVMEDRRSHLRELGKRLQRRLQPLSPAILIEPSHIQPFVVGDARKTVELSKRLLERGMKVLPIRTPTVPPGTERLRISLNAAMTYEDVDRLAETLEKEI